MRDTDNLGTRPVFGYIVSLRQANVLLVAQPLKRRTRNDAGDPVLVPTLLRHL